MFVPGRPRRLASSRALGLVIPAAAMAVGVALASSTGGADFLTALAAVVTPILAAGAGWARGWPRPWLPALAVPGAVRARVAPARLARRSGGGSRAHLRRLPGRDGVVAALAPQSWLVVGLVLLVVLDCVLVWGDRSVGPAMNTLLNTASRRASGGRCLRSSRLFSGTRPWAGSTSRPRPSSASSLPGASPPPPRRRSRAGLWGLLLVATSPIAATPPVLAGLLAGYRRSARVSTSPGAPRSPHSTSSAGRSRSPSSGTASQDGALDQHRMEPLTAVRRGDDRRPFLAPHRDHAVDRVRVKIRAVGEDDDRGLDLLGKLLEPTTERRARAALPLQALDGSRLRLDLVRADDDDHVVDGARARRGRSTGASRTAAWAIRTASRLRRREQLP